MSWQTNGNGSFETDHSPQPRQAGAFQTIVWEPLKRHRGKAIVLWVAVVAGGTAYALLLKDVYRAEGRLLVRLGRENVMLDPTANLGQGPISAVPATREGEMYTVVETLRSRQLFESLVDDVTPEAILADQKHRVTELIPWKKPPAAPRDAAATRAEKMLKIEPLRKSNLLSVTCDAHDAELSERMAAKYIELCMTHHRSMYRNPTAHEFFAQQVNLLSDKLHGTEAELLKVKREAGVTSIDQQRRLLMERASTLESELASTERLLSGNNAEIAVLEKQLASLPAVVRLQQTDGNPHTATDSMRDQLFTLELREKQLAAELTDEHFRLKQVREQLVEARRIFDLQENRRQETTEGRNPAYEQVQTSLLKLGAEVASTDVRRRKIEPQLAEVRRRLEALNETEMQVAKLERDRELQQADYLKYASSLEQLRIDNALEEERISNISVAQPPSGSSEPIGPDRPLLIGLSIVVATFLSLGLATVLGAEPDQSAAAVHVSSEPDSPADCSYPADAYENGRSTEASNGHAAEADNGRPAEVANGHVSPAVN
jgi:polysaccharide biosynthesis protein PslE